MCYTNIQRPKEEKEGGKTREGSTRLPLPVIRSFFCYAGLPTYALQFLYVHLRILRTFLLVIQEFGVEVCNSFLEVGLI